MSGQIYFSVYTFKLWNIETYRSKKRRTTFLSNEQKINENNLISDYFRFRFEPRESKALTNRKSSVPADVWQQTSKGPKARESRVLAARATRCRPARAAARLSGAVRHPPTYQGLSTSAHIFHASQTASAELIFGVALLSRAKRCAMVTRVCCVCGEILVVFRCEFGEGVVSDLG